MPPPDSRSSSDASVMSLMRLLMRPDRIPKSRSRWRAQREEGPEPREKVGPAVRLIEPYTAQSDSRSYLLSLSAPPRPRLPGRVVAVPLV